MKKGLKVGTIILIVLCFIGLCLLLYPTVADYWNRNFTTRVISDYVEMTENITKEDFESIWKEAQEYNKELLERPNQFSLTDELSDRYNQTLDLTGTGIMGYIEIGKINVSLPIYHGTSDKTLQSAIGHIDWSSLPTGGVGTHCVLSGHRGLVTAKIFSNLDMLREGDTFTLTILDEVLTYEVDQIRTVLPEDIYELAIDREKDYCTLVTCTPYGINTHRLLVRGHRVENEKIGAAVVSEAVLVDQLIVAVFLAVPLLFILVLMVMFKKPESAKNKGEEVKILTKAKGEENDEKA